MEKKTFSNKPVKSSHAILYSRHEFLRGLSLSAAGSVLLNPLVGKLSAEVQGRSQPTRILFVMEGNGCPPNQVHPTNLKLAPIGKRQQTVEESFQAEDLPNALKPVTDYADRMLILQGISGRICGGGHSTYFGALGCFNTREGKHVLGPHSGLRTWSSQRDAFQEYLSRDLAKVPSGYCLQQFSSRCKQSNWNHLQSTDSLQAHVFAHRGSKEPGSQNASPRLREGGYSICEEAVGFG